MTTAPCEAIAIPAFLRRKPGERASMSTAPIFRHTALAAEALSELDQRVLDALDHADWIGDRRAKLDRMNEDEKAALVAIVFDKRERDRDKARVRIRHMIAKKESAAAIKAGARWDARRGRWVLPNGKPAIQERPMIEVQQQTYGKHSSAVRAARARLGNPDAVDGVDFTTERKGDEFAVSFRPKECEMKMPDKLAAGPTGIERQYGAKALTPEAKRAAAKRAAESVGPAVVAVLAADAAIAKASKAAAKKKPAKAPKKKAAPKAKATPAGPMNGARIPDGPSAEQVRRDKAAAKVRDEAAKAKGGKTKVQIVADLLQRPEGTTTREILDATGWPAVSVPQQAKMAKLKLRKEKRPGERTRYYGTPT